MTSEGLFFKNDYSSGSIEGHKISVTSKNKGIISHPYYMFVVDQLWLCSMFSLWQPGQITVLHLRSSYSFGRGGKGRI